MIIADSFDQPVGVGDIIVYAGCSSSSPHLTRAEVLEIIQIRKKIHYTNSTHFYWSNYKMKVRGEGNDKSSTLTRAPFIKVANAIDFDEYVASLAERLDIDVPA